MRSQRILFGLFIIIATAWFGNPITRADVVIGGDFSLTDQDGRPFQLQQLRGKVVLLFFGYTFCPDICPAELANLSVVLNELEDVAEQVQGVFVTVDPERDKPQVIKNYIGYFNKHLIGLTGSRDEIYQVANQYRARFKKHLRSGGAYSIDHTANLYIIDRTGELSTAVPYGLPSEHVLAVVLRLVAIQP